MARYISMTVAGLFAIMAMMSFAEAFRVLSVFPYGGRSHSIMFKAMMHDLVDRGHEVVELCPFPLTKPRENYTVVDISKAFPTLASSFEIEQWTDMSRSDFFSAVGEYVGADFCRKVFGTKEFRDIMSGVYGKFDVVFTEIWGSDCWTAVAYKLQLPLISIATAPDYACMHQRVGSVDNPSYISTQYELAVGQMTLLERCSNVLGYLANNFLHKWYVEYPCDPVVREFFGEETPPIAELVKRTSLIMVNRHVSVNQARPVNPNVINVAGVHLREKPDVNNLDKDLRQWIEEAEHGVIFFSLGSLIRSASLPSATLEALLAAFATLPQRVLWKYEDAGTNFPTNVRVAPWLPQADILAHPNVILFLTHGGLMGTTEALSLGVPMLGIPLFADQGSNIRQFKQLGIALELNHRQITKENVLAAVHELTNSSKYRDRSREVAALYADRPITAAREAVWWTEHVVRTKGARHLRPLGADMPLYQYLLLDVLAVFLAAAGAILAVLLVVLRRLLRLLRTPTQAQTAKAMTGCRCQ